MDREEELLRNAELEQHLFRVRHPRPGDEFFEAAKSAIAAVDAGDGEHAVTLPSGRTSTAETIVDGLRLEPFLTGSDDEL